ncbi:hypothetical protein [Noviherbaspirillum aridicola]|uniref:Uncharacterized protein n=1 Tax=Noviherbaspirillum aridicola TaxID=2849687 RepID=A0ABQ4Q9I7_9BURK|nr:hypothetical protein [Noviherbaspirillum aridicola]GIZ53881.1 hypothetical protein NCCP691_38950 [Noviherbaspirillum aridicola]
MLLAVETTPGLHGDPEPSAFRLGERPLAVLQIVDRWMGQNEHYFKLQASDHALYILRHNLIPDTWELTLFQSPLHPPR